MSAGGRAAIAQDAPTTTSSPVASAAAGRSQATSPVAPCSGRNRSTTAPYAYLILMPAGSRYLAATLSAASRPVRYLAATVSAASRPVRYLARQPAQPADWNGTGGPAAILARILSSPSAPGSMLSAARRSARRSVCSSMA